MDFLPGHLVNARGRTWVVLSGSEPDWLRLRPVGGSDSQVTELDPAFEIEPVTSAVFPPPDPHQVGSYSSARLLLDALRFQLRGGAGPFRSFGSIAVEPRSYQLVPLLMALRQQTVRLLIADDVGIGKTIEAGLIVRELLDRGEIDRFAVLCPPHLTDQWVTELVERFNINAKALTASTAAKLEKSVPHGRRLTDAFPYLVVSLDYIKSPNHRETFLALKIPCILVDEAHTCTRSSEKHHKRYELLSRLAEAQDRHMIFLTATPHSGDEEAFYNLLSLLDKEFGALRELENSEKDPNARRRLRDRLQRHFIQRRRKDIRESIKAGSEPMTGFPVRMTKELTWKFDPQWLQFLEKVQSYCRELINQSNEDNQLIWYSVIALFRCIASSPDAAVLALENRVRPNEEEAKCRQEALIDLEDSSSASEVAETALEDSVDLQALLLEAKQLREKASDRKFELLRAHVKQLLDDGFNPVIFCRFVATAEYLAKRLAADPEFSQMVESGELSLGCATGQMPPEDRKSAVEGLMRSQKRILAATDCLSEGINLQEVFNSVIHYDLAWNPTRHEQREGRIDRFGQKSPEVRCSMIWGADNPVDGFILKVILAKNQIIRKSLGVSVPVPQRAEDIHAALLRSELFKQIGASQQSLFDAKTEASLQNQLNAEWEDALEKVKKQHTIFAQYTVKPEEAFEQWRKTQRMLGGRAQVEAFCRRALAAAGAPIEKSSVDGCYRIPVDRIANPSLARRLQDEGISNKTRIDFDRLHRTSNLINVLSEEVVEQALEGGSSFACRSAITESATVDRQTRVWLLRIRYQMSVGRGAAHRDYLQEEILAVSASGLKQVLWLSASEAEQKLPAEGLGRYSSGMSRKMISDANDFLVKNMGEIEKIIAMRCEQLKQDYESVSGFSRQKGAIRIEACLPPDVMGSVVLLPPEDEE